MSTKAKINYGIDIVIGLAFTLSALSGIILLLVPSGYQGGRNPYYGQTVLLLTTHQWSDLHTWSSIALLAGVGAHLVLHWRWVVCMTERLIKGAWPRKAPSSLEPQSCPVE